MYYVYIVKCSDDSLYTGITTNITRRIQQHNGAIPGGAKYTQNRQPVVLVFQSEHKDRSTASKEEMRIKKLTRSKKKNLINLSS